MKNKYGNKKCQYMGIVFDSKHEMERYRELYLLERAGEISDLQTQVPYLLIPPQFDDAVAVELADLDKKKKPKLLERKCEYIADFIYRDADGRLVVEDAKGVRTKEYLIKRKLMLYVHKIRVVEV
ncbi:MAG: DUF1064 domain-containing protein [Clostridiales bacterium]|nr:DUF1064 domain-containing protein [Clostridiales bacterium]